jgi:flavin-dependent dehydrogenase
MDTCDILIVGGGPAGSTCAGKLRQAGLDVLLLDKETFPRDKPCAGWITPAVLVTLAIDQEEYGRGRVLQEISSFRTGLMDGPEVVTRYGKAVSYGIRRCEFDHYLL